MGPVPFCWLTVPRCCRIIGSSSQEAQDSLSCLTANATVRRDRETRADLRATLLNMSTRRSLFKRLAAALIGARVAPEVISIKGVTHSHHPHYWPPVLDHIEWYNHYQNPLDHTKYYEALMKAYKPEPSKFMALLSPDYKFPEGMGYNYSVDKHEA